MGRRSSPLDLSSNRSRSSSGSSLLFRHSQGSGNVLESKVEFTAARRPGKLLKSTLQAMSSSLDPLAPKLKDDRPAIVFQFLQRALQTRFKIEGRNERELRTLAVAADYVLRGDLERASEVMLQRFKRVETQSTGVLPGHVAERLEALPPSEVTSLSLKERAEAVRLDQK